MNESRQKGNYTGGFVLFGYRVENKKLIIHEDEAQIVRQIFTDYASGRLVTSIIAELHEKGILNRGKPFARNTVYHLLANEIIQASITTKTKNLITFIHKSFHAIFLNL